MAGERLRVFTAMRTILTLALIALFAVSFTACHGEVDASVSTQINSEAAEVWPSALEARKSLADGIVNDGDSGWLRGDTHAMTSRSDQVWEGCYLRHTTQVRVEVANISGTHAVVKLRRPDLKNGGCAGLVLLPHDLLVRQTEGFLVSNEGKRLLLEEEANAALDALAVKTKK